MAVRYDKPCLSFLFRPMSRRWSRHFEPDRSEYRSVRNFVSHHESVTGVIWNLPTSCTLMNR